MRAGSDLLSIPQLEDDGVCVTYDTDTKWAVYTPQYHKINFQRDTGMCNRMPYIDVRAWTGDFALANIREIQQKGLDTVRKNYKGFTKREVKGAITARITQGKLAHIPDEKFKQLVSSKFLKHCHVKVNDVTNARTIFGPNLPGLGGRTTRQKSERVEPEYIGIPRGIYERHKIVTFTVDVMFVMV